MSNEPRRIVREKRTIRAMVGIYCRGHHGTSDELCVECREFLDYAVGRLDRCPYGGGKPTCGKCPIHCYKPKMKEKAKVVMRYAGPRLMLRHPILTFFHFLDGRRPVPDRPKKSDST